MKQHITIVFFLLIWSQFVLAQETSCTYSIKGKVLDADTKEPIPYVTVKVKDIEKYALTDEKGDFLLEDLCSKSNVLIISSLGYSNITKEYKPGTDSYFYLTPEITGLEGIIIQGERRKEEGTETISQTRLSKEEIRNIPTQSLGAAVAKVDGVTFASVGTNVQLPVIHGLTGNRILFLNNGLKHAFQNWGNQHAPEIDINAANNVTVIKGAAGVRFGPEALSGVVLVEPNPLRLENSFYATVGTSFQSNGRGGNTNFEVGNGSKKWSYFLNGNYTRLGDLQAPNFNLTNTGKEERSFGVGLRRNFNKWDAKLYYNFIEQNLGQLRGAFAVTADAFIEAINADVPRFTFPFSYNINEPNQVLQHQIAKAEVDWNYADDGKLTFRFGAQRNRREEFDVRRNAELPIIDLELITFDYQLELEHPSWQGLDGLIGIQYFAQENENDALRTTTTPFIPNYVAKRFSLFATERLKLGSNTLEAGIRFDIEENTVAGREVNQDIFRDEYSFTNFTASLGYLWKFSNNSSFKTNIGSAFRTPNVAELFSFGQQGFSSTFGLLRFTNTNGVLSTNEVALLDESDVDLERGYKFTNEFRTSNENNAHAITVYGHYIENFVFDRPLGVFGGVRGPQFAFFVDQADALFLGFDYTWKKEITNELSATYGLSFLWSRNVGENEPLINQPPIATNLELQWNQGKFWFFESSKWSIRPSYTFRQFQTPRTVSPESLVDGSEIITEESEIFDFIDAPEGYFLLDISWNFTWKNLGVGITAQNVLNTSYRNYLNEFRYFSDEPARNILLNLNYNF